MAVKTKINPNKLISHPRNYREHPPEQLEHIVKSIQENGIYRPIVVARDNIILAGHGVVKASLKLGLKSISIYPLDIDSESPAALKLLTGDNEISRLGVIDNKMLLDILTEITEQHETDLIGTGFSADTLVDLLPEDPENDKSEEATTPYSPKIESLTYEPKNQKPAIAELFDLSKTKKLMFKIKSSKLSQVEKDFLMLAAQRHCVFDYQKIADFYAHSTPLMQSLMEDSALVIIDFDKAIQHGYVRLTDEIKKQYGEEYDVG